VLVGLVKEIERSKLTKRLQQEVFGFEENDIGADILGYSYGFAGVLGIKTDEIGQ